MNAPSDIKRRVITYYCLIAGKDNKQDRNISIIPDEFSHSKETIGTKGANEKAKANMVSAIGELIQIADNKEEYPNVNAKHNITSERNAPAAHEVLRSAQSE